MKQIETVYRGHTIAIRDKSEFPANLVKGTAAPSPVTIRIIEVDQVDVTSRCRTVTTDEQKTEEARRFVDRIYRKGKSGS